ncbi:MULTISPECIES: 8-oxo-dGTP diphosphatase MutT [Pasteurellaceae]|uniref:8-oxo-dGTP diphosphatase n=2 Tax=Pasteurella atlantica TaxID=2827233 RepID=A0AAW8CNJ8_9PAST|nr:8-oxo-dGTP diphosphatase MutT [Pasteurella atlantica]MBR0572980.1 8-oxo-dGTP diphosphatase MutT [Pasteurella atlantica]MDP8038893.1 8-oxo-dGTP diphosphatase MutT [Pasteurella atlantica]MDP8040998.1 8-oxo-dGTP diphosphatase MutT [Pasteurella atlantica]MDP8043134.1 8-oxo-dGTP diphosphatase MutT [Pasteurella atlantica]MDP8045220.1 8-oxo-dGTP diphosphatase MutT [Pasteurella atlantica]
MMSDKPNPKLETALKPLVQVAAAIIRNEFGQIYLAQRLEGQDFAQSLEFPGGKVNDGETPEEAVVREIEEEVGIHILSAFPYEHFSFEYPTKIIEFFFYLVEDWVGEPFGREGQEGFWIEQSELDSEQFPPANEELIKRLKSEVSE